MKWFVPQWLSVRTSPCYENIFMSHDFNNETHQKQLAFGLRGLKIACTSGYLLKYNGIRWCFHPQEMAHANRRNAQDGCRGAGCLPICERHRKCVVSNKDFVRVAPNRKRSIKTSQTPTAADSAGFPTSRKTVGFLSEMGYPDQRNHKMLRKVKTRRGRLMTSYCRASRRPPELPGARDATSRCRRRRNGFGSVGRPSEISEDRRKASENRTRRSTVYSGGRDRHNRVRKKPWGAQIAMSSPHSHSIVGA